MKSEKTVALYSKAPWRQLQITGRWKISFFHDDDEGGHLCIEAREMKCGRVHPDAPAMWFREECLRLVEEWINTPAGE